MTFEGDCHLAENATQAVRPKRTVSVVERRRFPACPWRDAGRLRVHKPAARPGDGQEDAGHAQWGLNLPHAPTALAA
jgi:hypothetical protein